MKLSVIVCTRNRAHAIIPCLDSIAQSLALAAPVDAEVVVVDNASEDNTSTVVREWANSCAFPVRLLHEPRKGLSNARNCALRGAQGDLLAWTDDDCRVSEEYVADLLRHDATDTEPVLRGGRVELGDPTDLPLTIKRNPAPRRWSRHMNSARYETLGGSVIGCNMSMRRALVDKVGPFDWRFSTKAVPAGEDLDYVFRTYLAGILIEYVPDIVVYHYHGRKSRSEGNRLMRNYMIARGAAYAKHFFREPNLCRSGYWDLRHTVQEIITGKNTYLPDMDYSYKAMMTHCLLGAVRFPLISVRGAR